MYFAGLFLAITGLTCSQFLIGISEGCLFASALWLGIQDPRKLTQLGHPVFYLWTGIFLLHLGWIWNADDKRAFWSDINIKLAFLLIPPAILIFPRISDRLLAALCYWFSFLLIAITTITMIRAGLNWEQTLIDIKESKPISPVTGVSHIYFSVFLAFAFFWLLEIYVRRRWWFHQAERRLVPFALVLLFLCLHALTARTGLLAFYTSAGVWITYKFFYARQWKPLSIAWLILILFPVAGYLLFPAFRARIENTRMDLVWYFNGGNPNFLSLATRMESYKAALRIIEAHPFTGVGMGDLKAEMMRAYEGHTLLIPENRELPHNQYLEYGCGFGLLGLSYIMFAWLFPLFIRQNTKSLLYIVLFVLISSACMVESMWERQWGIVFTTLLLMLTLRDAEVDSKRNTYVHAS